MSDRDDIHGRYWRSCECGLIAFANKSQAYFTAYLPEKQGWFRRIGNIACHRTSLDDVRETLATPEGRAALQAHIDHFTNYIPRNSPFAGCTPVTVATNFETLDLGNGLFLDMADLDGRCECAYDHPLCGATLRRRQKAEVAAFMDNTAHLYDEKVRRHRACQRRGFGLALISIAGGVVAVLQADTPAILFTAGLASMGVVLAQAFLLFRDLKEDEAQEGNYGEACLQNFLQGEAEMDAQEACLNRLMADILHLAHHTPDEARLRNRLAEAPEDRAFLLSLVRWLEGILETQHRHRALARHMLALLARGVPDRKRYEALYLRLGPGVKISRNIWFGLRILAGITAAGMVTKWLAHGKGGGAVLTALSVALAGTIAAGVCAYMAKDRLRRRLSPHFVWRITGGNSPGTPPKAPLEKWRKQSDRAQTASRLAEEERRRGRRD